MSVCEFCDMELCKTTNDFDEYEGKHLSGIAATDDYELFLFNTGSPDKPFLTIANDQEDEWGLFEINFCPMCGRDLRKDNSK